MRSLRRKPNCFCLVSKAKCPMVSRYLTNESLRRLLVWLTTTNNSFATDGSLAMML